MGYSSQKVVLATFSYIWIIYLCTKNQPGIASPLEVSIFSYLGQILASTRKTETGPPLPSPPLLRHVLYIVLYCTILYYTVLYCTILYYTVLYCTILSPAFTPSLQKFICFETLMGRTRMNADILLSLLRSSLPTLSNSLRSVVTQCCLHKKTKKWPRQLDTAHTHR